MASIWDALFPKQDYRTAAPSGGYADLYANSLLGDRTDTPTSVGAMETGKDFIPGIGDAIALKEAYDAASRGDKVAAGLLAAGAAVGLIPGAGDMVARPIMAAGRKAADLADRVEFDPTAVGTVGGNVRLRPAGQVKQSAAEMRRQANIDRFGYDPNEVPDDKPGAGLLSEYAGEHQAPMRDGNAPAFNLAGDIYPDDIYSSNAVQYYGTGNQSMDKDTMGLLQSLRGQPDADVKIYRAVPKGVDDLNAGDWVTVNKQYAQDHGEAALGGDFDIVERKVKASEIFTNGDSIHEFGYDPLPPAPSLPTPRNEAEAMAQKVLEMRAAGDAGDVTEDMMALADDSYMYDNTPIDMSVGARVQRSEDMGADMLQDFYHGTAKGGYVDTTDIKSFDPSRVGDRWNADDKGFSITSSLQDANYYATPSEPGRGIDGIRNDNLRGGAIYPLVDLSSVPYNVRPKDSYQGTIGAWDERPDNTYELMDAAGSDYARMYDDGVEMRVVMDPRNLRSRFARFDPEFKHLRNLSAGVGAAPIGLLALREEQKRANEEKYKRGLLQ
jgi:hypothetical protein